MGRLELVFCKAATAREWEDQKDKRSRYHDHYGI